MLQYEELRLRLENLWPGIEDLANAIGLDQKRREAAELEQRTAAHRTLSSRGISFTVPQPCGFFQTRL